jgi:hypothetical protein
VTRPNVQAAKEVLKEFKAIMASTQTVRMAFLPFLCHCTQFREELLRLDTHGDPAREAVVDALKLVENVYAVFANEAGVVRALGINKPFVPALAPRSIV